MNVLHVKLSLSRFYVPQRKGDDIYDKDLRKIQSSKALYSMVEFVQLIMGYLV